MASFFRILATFLTAYHILLAVVTSKSDINLCILMSWCFFSGPWLFVTILQRDVALEEPFRSW